MSSSPWLFKCWGKLARGAQEGLEFVAELARTPVPLTVPKNTIHPPPPHYVLHAVLER